MKTEKGNMDGEWAVRPVPKRFTVTHTFDEMKCEEPEETRTVHTDCNLSSGNQAVGQQHDLLHLCDPRTFISYLNERLTEWNIPRHALRFGVFWNAFPLITDDMRIWPEAWLMLPVCTGVSVGHVYLSCSPKPASVGPSTWFFFIM